MKKIQLIWTLNIFWKQSLQTVSCMETLQTRQAPALVNAGVAEKSCVAICIASSMILRLSKFFWLLIHILMAQIVSTVYIDPVTSSTQLSGLATQRIFVRKERWDQIYLYYCTLWHCGYHGEFCNITTQAVFRKFVSELAFVNFSKYQCRQNMWIL